MRRIAYSPEVRVYIQPNETKDDGSLVDPIDISKDIIEGSVERRTNDISTARFVIQGRRLGKENETDTTTSVLLSRKIRPMDRIIVYLKKTKPILVFSGYIDLVPLVQFVPEPVVIEASCSLKRLQYTYWDPTLPNVMQAFLKMGMIVQNNESGFNVFQPPGQDSSGLGEIEDQGFPKLLSFLLVDVGGWDPQTVFIEPLPQEWLDNVEPMFRNLIETDNTWDAAKEFLDAWLGASDSGGGGGGDTDGGAGTGSTANSAVLENPEEIEKAIDQNIKKHAGGDTDITGADFVKYGQEYNIDPRFLAAVAAAETHYGTTGQGRKPPLGYYNMYGLGNTGRKMSSRAQSIKESSIQLREKDYYLGQYPNQTIDGWIVYWTNNSQSHLANVKKFWKEMETPNGKVYFNKPYSIVDQGLGIKVDGARQNPDRNSAAGRGTKDKTTLTVYLEAVGAGPNNNISLAGYQKLDFFGRGYEAQSSQNRMAKNRDVANRIKDNVNTLIKNFIKSAGPGGTTGPTGTPKLGPFPKDFFNNFDPIDIQLVNHSDTTKGWKGDLYLAIDHSDGERNNNICYCVTPKLSSPMLTNPTIPIVGKDYGSGWKKPSSLYGRDSIKDKALIENSNKFRNLLVKSKNYSKSKVSSSGLTIDAGSSSLGGNVVSAQRAWNGTIPGFFYTAASACAYLQLPNKGDGYSDKQSSGYVKETDDWAWQIAYAIYQYYVTEKLPDKIKKTTASGNTGDSESQVKYKDLKPEGFELDRGGKGNDWAGSMWRCLALQKLTGIKPSSQKRSTVNTASGGVSDHYQGNDVAYAMDLPGNPTDGKTNKAATSIVEALGGPKNWGDSDHAGETFNVNYDGYRYNIIWRSNVGGNHYDHIHVGVKRIGATKNLPIAGTPVTGGDEDTTDTGDDSQNYQNAVNFNRAAFNVGYSFPGSLVDSILLRGKRALQNDVPLLDSVRDITIGSMRNFASLPNGDFIAWFPDYFNIARRNPWLRISPVEIKKCTIDLSDKYLTTHVYIMGNPYGIGNLPSATSEWYEKLQGAGIVTIEQRGILDSFLFTKDDLKRKGDGEDYNLQQDQSQSAINFLEKYGARPLTESNLTIRHPLVEFFYAYNTFITNWAKQFISRVEFTFMPELFPGMIIEIPNYQEENKSFTFYVEEVTHTFSYTGGFSTSAVLIAPGQVSYTNDDPLGLIPVRPPNKAKEPTRYKIAPPAPPKNKTYKEWLGGRKSTEKLAAQWKKLNGLNK